VPVSSIRVSLERPVTPADRTVLFVNHGITLTHLEEEPSYGGWYSYLVQGEPASVRDYLLHKAGLTDDRNRCTI